MTNQPPLPLFEDEPVSTTRVRITKAGDGLSDALAVSPQALPIGSLVYYLLEGRVEQVNHRYLGKDEDRIVARIHTVETVKVTQVDPDTAEKLLALAAEDLDRRRSEASAQPRLDDDDETPDDL